MSDSLCVVALCFHQKLLLARLLMTSGNNREAAALLDQWGTLQPPTSTPVAVVAELERGQVAERLADTARARQAYALVADLWRNADASLAPYVRAAREGMARMGG